MCIQLNTQLNTQNSCGLEACITIGFDGKVISNTLVSFTPEVIKCAGIFHLYTKIYHGKFSVSKYSGFEVI